MYWPSSGKTAGYEKGKYSHALPAGVAFIGLFSFAVGLIISIGFPSIVSDWTNSYVCIMGPWQNEYSAWLNDADRSVSVTVRFWNLTNRAEFLLNRSSPNFSLSEPNVINYLNKKYDVEFSDGRVRFKRFFTNSNYSNNETKCESSCSKNGSEVILFNPKYFRKFENESESIRYLQKLGSDINASLTYWHMDMNQEQFKSWLFSAFNGACKAQNHSIEGIAKLCRLFQMPFDGLLTTRKIVVTNMAISMLDEILNFNISKFLSTFVYTGHQQCSDVCDNFTSKFQFLVRYHLCKTTDMLQVLDRCDKTNRLLSVFGDNLLDQKQTLDILERIIFTSLKLFVNFRSDDDDFVFNRSSTLWWTPERTSHNSDLIKIILNEKVSSRLDLCVDKWHLDTSTIFRWSEFNGYSFPNQAYSEFAVPPVPKINPCLPPVPKKFYTVIFDGIWNPIRFLYKNSIKLNSESLQVYEAANGGFTDDAVEVDLNLIFGLPLFVTAPCGHVQSNKSVCVDKYFQTSSKFEFSVEPITGSIWNYDVSYQVNAKLPEELFALYNISTNLKNQMIPWMHIRRTSDVTLSGGNFFKTTIKPFLMVICGGTVVFHCLAILLLMLAAHLAIRLHWKPIKGRRFVAQLPDLDFQQLNTVKLRKLLGQ